MQRVRLLGRIGNIPLLGKKSVLRREVFTMDGHGKGNEVPCITAGGRDQEEILLHPMAHILQVPGKETLAKFSHAYNYWLKVPADKLVVVNDIGHMHQQFIILIDDIQDNSILRRGIPVAHLIYGVASTINAAIYLHLKELKKVQSLNHPDAITVVTEQLLDAYYAQGLEIYWRDNYTCPSLEEYKQMCERSKDRAEP